MRVDTFAAACPQLDMHTHVSLALYSSSDAYNLSTLLFAALPFFLHRCAFVTKRQHKNKSWHLLAQRPERQRCATLVSWAFAPQHARSRGPPVGLTAPLAAFGWDTRTQALLPAAADRRLATRQLPAAAAAAAAAAVPRPHKAPHSGHLPGPRRGRHAGRPGTRPGPGPLHSLLARRERAAPGTLQLLPPPAAALLPVADRALTAGLAAPASSAGGHGSSRILRCGAGAPKNQCPW